MATATISYTDPQLEIIASIRDDGIHASIAELRERDRMTLALRAALKNGVTLDDLSEASGIPCADIRRRVDGDLHLTEDVAGIFGMR